MSPHARPGDLKPEHRPYEPRGTALRLWRSRAPEVVLSGPAGTGKSRACLEKLHYLAERYPGMRGLILRKTRESLSEAALVTFEEKVVPAGHPVLTGPGRHHRQVYRYPNGSQIVVGGLDKPGKVMSTEYDVAYVQELIECNEEDLENVTTRLRNGVIPYQQFIGDTNPWAPAHWLKLRADRGLTLMLDSRHEENPVLFDARRGRWTPEGARYIAILDRLTGARRERLRFGRWVAAEGLVYDQWEPAVHLIDRFVIPPEWRRIRSIDFGFTNPFVCQWWAIDHDDRMYLYRELYRTGRTVRRHAQDILRLSAGEAIEATVADHDAEDRATLAEEGIDTVPAYKAISVGIQAVQERLLDPGDGHRRLYLLRDSLVETDEGLVEAKLPLSTVQEFDGYIWPKRKPTQEEKSAKEVPVDQNNHGMDALRYATAYVDDLSEGVYVPAVLAGGEREGY